MNRRSVLEFSPGAAGPLLGREVIVPVASITTRPDPDADDQGWQDQALCAQTDPEAFFPEKGGSTREAKRVCQACPVRSECLEYALENGEQWGIWGGLSERERRRLKHGAVTVRALCRKNLHVMTDENRSTDGHCRACRNDSDRQARARKALAA